MARILAAALVVQGRRVVHIAAHSFTPERAGEIRNADIGLLYDPSRDGERALSIRWQDCLGKRLPELGCGETTLTPGNPTG